MVQKYDVVIVGAALNGLAMALSLGGHSLRRPLSVAIVDPRNPRDALTRASDGRASAITQSSRRMFEALGLWELVQKDAQPVAQIIVTDHKGPATERPVLLRFDDEAAESDAAMALIENHALLKGLMTAINQSPRITLLTGERVLSADHQGSGQARVHLGNGITLKAPLIIAADGAKSRLRTQAGIEMVGWDYDQMGLVATFAHELPHGQRAEEHFGAHGPFALLPLTENRCSIVWTCSKAEGKRLLSLERDEFESELLTEIGSHLGSIRLLSKVQGFPLGLWIAKEFTAKRLALIGDAAHIVHPLAGLGFNLGLKDVAALAEVVGDAYALGLDIGSDNVLQSYSAWRRFDTVTTAATMDGFNKLFSNSNPLLKTARDLGLGATNALAPLRSLFMREAAGVTGALPKLLRGVPL